MIGVGSALLGGVGLFLMGMILMTDGLKGAAGASLQRGLSRLTRGPGQALLAGAGLTVLIQSSSATTVATIGFVSAGMLTFPQALGVLMGANLGTTSTGWIVALLGLKLRIGAAALPFVGVGALLRLLASGRRAHVGMTMAGFGLIFVGIDILQDGMVGVSERFDPATFPSAQQPVGLLLLVLFGAAMTVVMQSSSAAVATTLTALHAGTLELSQAAYLVVGQNVGTTVKAALAAVGATIPARRTAVGHILFNLLTGVVALLLLPLVLPLLVNVATKMGRDDLTLVIAGFHTGFNLLGVLLLLPVVGSFSRVVARIVPERAPALTRHLDQSMQEIPSVALEAARSALRELAARLGDLAASRLTTGWTDRDRGEADPEIDEAISRIRAFLGSLDTGSEGPEEFAAHVRLLHAMDHVDRLREAAREPADPSSDPRATAAAARLQAGLRGATDWLRAGPEQEGAALATRLADLSSEIATARRRQRATVLERTAERRLSPELADARLQGMRWVDRIAYHTWRTVHHLTSSDRGRGESPVESFDDARMEGGN